MKARPSFVEQPDLFKPADERWTKFSDQTKTAILELVATLLRQTVSSQPKNHKPEDNHAR
jgi:hypothetical protein